jgi:phenylacetate-CoA ligase
MRIPPVLQLRKLRRQQWLDVRALEGLQEKKLARLIGEAYSKINYYRRLFESAGVKPSDIKTADDLVKIPITERHDLQESSLFDITATGADLKKCRRLLTAGSTGSPLMVYRTRSEDNLIDAVWARAFLENGQRIWDKRADYHAYPYLPKRWFEHFGVWRRTTIPTLADPKKQMEQLKQIQPDIISGPPSSLVNLTETIQRERVGGINPRLVFTMGSLLDQRSRALIGAVLRARVFDYYGSTEVGCIGWECSSQDGYHMNSDAVIVEVVNREGEPVKAGESGRVVCTGLISYTMPFIRYDLGDIGVLGSDRCSCGRVLPLLKNLEGRVPDFFVSSDGTRHAPGVIFNRVKLIRGIRQFRVIQENRKTASVEIVPQDKPSPEISEELKKILRSILGEDADIQIQFVDWIPRAPSGKVETIVSKVKKEF